MRPNLQKLEQQRLMRALGHVRHQPTSERTKQPVRPCELRGQPGELALRQGHRAVSSPRAIVNKPDSPGFGLSLHDGGAFWPFPEGHEGTLRGEIASGTVTYVRRDCTARLQGA